MPPVEPAAAPAAPRRGGAALGEGGGGRQHQRVGHVHAEAVVTNFIINEILLRFVAKYRVTILVGKILLLT